MMHGPWMFFKFFGIFPLVGIGILLALGFLVARRFLGSAKQSSLPEQGQQRPSQKMPSANIPEELKQAGQQVLENLDWEIRFLEKQRLEVDSPEERRDIEAELRRKRDEYQATIERLEP